MLDQILLGHEYNGQLKVQTNNYSCLTRTMYEDTVTVPHTLVVLNWLVLSWYQYDNLTNNF